MTLLSRYTTSNFVHLLNEIYSDRFYSSPFYTSNSRFVTVNDKEGRLEIELAGYSKDEIEVYKQEDILYVKAKKKDKSSSRSYYRSWNLATDEKIGGIKYENGLLTVEISKVVPEEPKREVYSIE